MILRLVGTLLIFFFLLPSPLAAQKLSAHLLWELGGIDGPEEVMWNRIADAEIIGQQIIILGHFPTSVRQFSIHGQFLRELGREGKGPSEFIAPTLVRASGDSISVYDFLQRRWVLFDRDGHHFDTRAHPNHPGTRTQITRPLGRVGDHYLGVTAWLTDESVHYPPALVEWTEPETVDTIAVIPTGLLMSRPRGGRQWNSAGGGVGSAGDVDVLGDSLVLLVDGFASTAVLYRRGLQGLEELRLHELPGESVPLTEDVESEIVRRYADRWDIDLSERLFRAPDTIPAWSGVHFVTTDQVWLKRGGKGGFFGGEEEWIRWSIGRGTFEVLRLPPGVEVLDAEDGLLLGLRRGEFDEPYLQLYEVRTN